MDQPEGSTAAVKALVLAYHSHNISGNTYATNDHIALWKDLEALTHAGARIVSLDRIVDMVEERSIGFGERVVGISFDDGPRFDFEDFLHSEHGPQSSFYGIMREFRRRHGPHVQPELHATSFVIASKEARLAMEGSAACGYPGVIGWLDDGWWRSAVETGLMAIGNHSWDHVHVAPRQIATRQQTRGNFSIVDNAIDAASEIAAASSYINEVIGGGVRLFAYPYGHVSDYLVQEYFPCEQKEHGMRAAFQCGGRSIAPDDSVWSIPRAVCGHDWKSPGELLAMLD